MGENERPIAGSVYYAAKDGKLEPLYGIEDEPEEEAQPWPKVNPALDSVVQLLIRMIKVVGDACAAAPPRVRHLALHARKQRTRKKNARRIAREYIKEARRH